MLIAAAMFATLCVGEASAQMSGPTLDRMTAEARQKGPCRDPWITVAYWDLTGSTRSPQGVGNLGECAAMLYNGGSWSSYAELYRHVSQFYHTAPSGTFAAARVSNGWKLSTTVAGTTVSQIISNDGASIISNDGGSIVAQGGGNLAGGGPNYKVVSSGNEKRLYVGKAVIIVSK